MNQERIKIALVDDHNLVRKSLRLLLESYKGVFDIRFEAVDGVDLTEQLFLLNEDELPEIILLDINMPRMDGIDAAIWLKKNYPNIKIIILSLSVNNELIIKMVKIGVSAYLSKEIDSDVLIAAIKSVHKSGSYQTAEVYNALLQRIKNEDNNVYISPNEKSFISHLASDLTYAEIAKLMNVSPRTVDGYRENLFHKTKTSSRMGLVIYAIKNKLIEI